MFEKILKKKVREPYELELCTSGRETYHRDCCSFKRVCMSKSGGVVEERAEYKLRVSTTVEKKDCICA